MSVYFILILSTFLGSILENKKNIYKKIIKYSQYIYILFFFILIAFNRDNSDYKNYVSIFNGTYGVLKEKGYIYFNKLIQILGGNYNIVPFIMGLLMIYVLFKKYSIKEKITLIFIYSIHNLIFDIIQIRNTFCILFILIGLKALQRRNNVKYLIYNFIATSFHKIGAIYFLFYILNKIKLKKYVFILVISNIINILFLDFYGNIFKKFYSAKASYIELDFNYGIFIFYLFSLIDALLVIYIEKGKKKDTLREIYIKFILFPILFLPLGIFNGELIQRLWRNAFLLKLIYCLKFSNSRKKKIIAILLVQQLLYLGFRFWRGPEFILSLLKQFNNIGFYF